MHAFIIVRVGYRADSVFIFQSQTSEQLDKYIDFVE